MIKKIVFKLFLGFAGEEATQGNESRGACRPGTRDNLR